MNNPASKHHQTAADTPKRIVVGLSGGVDSSIAAYLLKQQGYDIEALFMKNWEEDDQDGHCNAAEDYSDARSVSEQLDIPLCERNFSAEYWDNVFEGCLSEFRAGRTPNPDILCNKEIKFNVFLEHAINTGADAIATGHYAQIKYLDNRYRLLKAVDKNKDQTYFLYTLDQAQLARALFPLGELTKDTVREIARKLKLVTHDKKDSTGICFIGERKFKTFLQRFINKQPGEIRTTDNELVGQHDGLSFYTIGQRKGLDIGGRKLKLSHNSGEPWYVAGKDLKTNTLIIAQGHDHPLLLSDKLTANQLHWICGKAPEIPFHCSAKTRYRQADQPCTIEEINKDEIKVSFETPQRAITPGQSIVFYNDEECLGGGIILK